MFTLEEFAVICHAHDLTAVGLSPEEAVTLARRLLIADAPVVVEQDHTSVVVISRARPGVRQRPVRSTMPGVDGESGEAPLTRSEVPATTVQASSPPLAAAATAAAATALMAAALCSCRHPRRVHDSDGICRLDGCGCLEYQRAVPGPPTVLSVRSGAVAADMPASSLTGFQRSPTDRINH